MTAIMNYRKSLLFRMAIILCGLVLCVSESRAQPFHWEYSARLPEQTPSMFVGLTGSASMLWLSAVPSIDKSISECNCLQSKGQSSVVDIGLASEYWFDNVAYTLRLGMQYNRINFGGRYEGFPVRGTDSLFVQEQGQLSSYNVILSGGAKYTLFPLALFLRAEIHALIAVRESMIFSRDIIFNGVERTETIIPGTIQSLRLGAMIGVGYDIAIAQNTYLSPEIFFRRDMIGMFNQPQTEQNRASNMPLGMGVRLGLFMGIP